MDIEKLVESGQKDWTQSVATLVCIWGAPLVACWKDRLRKMQSRPDEASRKLFVNEFRHQRTIANGSADEFVNAGSDFLYSTAVIDLNAGPVILESGQFGNRWFGVQLLDPHMETVENFGTRRTGSQISRTTICGPGQTVANSDDGENVQCDSNYMYMVARIAVVTTESLAPVHRLQDSLKIVATVNNGSDRSLSVSRQCIDQFEQQTSRPCPDGLKFYQELAAVLCHITPRLHESMLGSLLSQIGIEIGEQFDEKKLTPAVTAGMIDAFQSADSILNAKFFEVGQQINGWGFVKDIGRYRNEYILRALVARHGIWANVPEESLYFIARTDEIGRPLSGHRTYLIKFEKAALPDVDAFWSLSYYDQNGRIPIDSAAPSFLNSRSDSLKYDVHGGVTVQLGPDAPEPGSDINWLPTQTQPFSLNLRCYQPTEAFRNGDVFVPPIVAIEGE